MTSHSYRDAGVDVDAGNALVDRIKPLARATRRPGAEAALGGFGALFDPRAAGYRDPLLVSTTDGVGTKLRVAIETGRHGTIGIDLVAMCVNDLLAEGAEPLFFLDYFATARLEPTVAEAVIAGIAEGCRASGCALIGGETAEMPGLYGAGDYDLAGFAVGAVERGAQLSARRVEIGDVLVGLASDGVHSNGFSLVRRLVAASGLAWDQASPFSEGATLGDAFLTPTRLYVRPVLAALRDGETGPAIHGIAHVTGGGLPDNVARILPDGVEAVIDAASWEVPPVFRWLRHTGDVEPTEMFRTFNCGVGLVLACAPGRADALIGRLRDSGERAWRIGVVRPRGGTDPVSIEAAEVPWRG